MVDAPQSAANLSLSLALFTNTLHSTFPIYRLNIYDFHRIQHGPNKGGYVHRSLIKGNPQLCHNIVRVYGPPIKHRKKVYRDKAKKGRGKNPRAKTTHGGQEGLDLLVADSSPSSACSPQPPSGDYQLPAWMTHSLLTECLPTPINESAMNTLSGYASNGLVGSFEKNPSRSIRQDSAASSGGSSNPNNKIRVFGEKEIFVNNRFSAFSSNSFGNNSSSFNWSSCGMEDFFKDVAKSLSSLLDVPDGEEQQDFHFSGGQQGNILRHDGGNHNAPFELAGLKPPTLQDLNSSNQLAARATITSAGTKSLVDCCPSAGSCSSSLMPTPADMLGLARTPTSPLASSFTMTAALNNNEDLNRSETVFPAKLHRLLQDAPKNGLSHIVSWIQGGTAFQIHSMDQFTSRVMSTYFSQSKFASFRRQLNLYGFHKSRHSEAVKGTYYYHESFLQNDPSLLHQIVRPKSPSRRKHSS
jgi:hypothetical protein